MSKKITLPRSEQFKPDSFLGQIKHLPKHTSNTTITRLIEIDGDVSSQLDTLSYLTAMNEKEISRILLRDALSRVELVERKVYEFRVNSEQEEHEEE